MANAGDSPNSTQVSHDIVTRWGGDPAILAEGFVPVPAAFLRHLAAIRPRITPTEALFVLELMLYKWDARAPFPGYKTVAENMGVSETYARKLARNLEKKGLIRRVWRTGTTNEYDLTPIFLRLAARAGRPKTAPPAR